MIKDAYYNIAGHTFVVRAPGFFLKQMVNMYPFLEQMVNVCPPFEVPPVEEPIFCMSVINRGIAPTMETPPLWVDMQGEDMPRIEVYHADKWLFRIAMTAKAPVCCMLVCSDDFKGAWLEIAPNEENVRFCIDNAIMLLYAFRTVSLRTLEMHAAVVVKDRQGFVFLGKSGTGKSTHAQQWLQAFDDAYLLNDDNPVLRVMDNGEVRVFGTPWSGKTPCYKNDSVPVAAIVMLSQAPENSLRRLRLPEAYAAILSSASGLKNEPQMAESMYNTIRHIVMTTPCYHLNCLPDTDAARVCYGERE